MAGQERGVNIDGAQTGNVQNLLGEDLTEGGGDA